MNRLEAENEVLRDQLAKVRKQLAAARNTTLEELLLRDN